MSDWDVIGGDPAPGSPDTVAAAAAVLSRVSSMASEARQALLGADGELDVSRWRGTAADAFRQDVSTLPRDLGDVAISYEEASAALLAYERALQSAQLAAASIRAAATQAASDATHARAQQGRAEQAAAGARSQLNSAVYRLSVLRKQIALATDPAARAALQASANAEQSSVARHEADLGLAQAAHDRHARDAAEAQDRLGDAIRQAESIRRQVSSAVDTAASLLARAERDAHVPNLVQQEMAKIRETIVEYGPVLADTLQLGASLFALAALILPFGAPAFMACALICAGGSLLATLTVDSLAPGGLTTDRLLDLGVKTLTLIAMALVPEAGLLAKSAGWAATGASTLQQYEEHGSEGLAFVVGGMLLGAAGSKAGGAVAGKVFGSVRKNATVGRLLQGVSNDIAKSNSKVLTVPLVSHSQYVQSLYGLGRIPPGGFLRGNGVSSAPQGRALKSSALAAEAGEMGGETATHLADWVATKMLKPDTSQEIDINLPIRGSGVRQDRSGAGGSA
ncbi:MAG: hypothetical protein ACXVXP_02110 [Mycobacteriaceae bacterium]